MTTFRILCNGQLTCMTTHGDDGPEAAAAAWRHKTQPGAFGWLGDQYGYPLTVTAVAFDMLAPENIVPITAAEIEAIREADAEPARLAVGDPIRSHDFPSRLYDGRPPCFVEGTITAIAHRFGREFYMIAVTRRVWEGIESAPPADPVYTHTESPGVERLG